MDEDDMKGRTGRGGTSVEGDHTENKKAGDGRRVGGVGWGGGVCGVEGGRTDDLMEEGGWKKQEEGRWCSGREGCRSIPICPC